MSEPWEDFQEKKPEGKEASSEKEPWEDFKTYSPPSLVESLAGEANEGLNAIGRGILSGVGKVSSAVDSVTGAPIRSGIGALEEGKGLSGGIEAFGKQFASDPADAPTGKDLAEKVGVSKKEYDTPLIKNPFTGERVKVSPAGLLGTGIEAATDPLTYAGLPEVKAAEMGIGAVKGSAVKSGLADYLQKTAEMRAAKAGTGQNLKQFKQYAKVAGDRAGSVERATNNIRKVGRDILDEPNLLGYFSSPASLGPRMEGAADKYGGQIGDIEKTIDKSLPKAVSGENIGKNILEYAASIPEPPQNKGLIDGLVEQAEFFNNKKNLDFKEAQGLKDQYSWKNVPKDAKISNQDALNKINQIISGEMNNAGELATEIDPSLPGAELKKAKSKYGSFAPSQDANTERMLKDLSNRKVSPSDYAAGGLGMIAHNQNNPNKLMGGVAGAAAGLLNNQVRTRGNAFVARSFDKMAKAFYSSPESLGKYQNIMKRAIQIGGGAPELYHKLLLNNDPDYFNLMNNLDESNQ